MEPSPNESRFDPYRPATVLLWCCFFLVGLVPVDVFFLLREAGWVVTQNAMINRPEIITLALSAYVAFFVWQRSGEAGLNPRRARGLALQTGLLGLIAFSTLPLGDWLQFHNIPIPNLRWLIFLTGLCKLVAWGILFSTVLRYNLGAGYAVFRQMVCVFPSARVPDPSPGGGALE